MIDLTSGNFVFGGKVFAIRNWDVWFATPFGVTPDIKEAIKRCKDVDIDPELNVTPIPVAIAEDGHYELFYSRR